MRKEVKVRGDGLLRTRRMAAPVAVAAVEDEPGTDRQESEVARLVFSLSHDLAGQSGVAQVDESPRGVGATRARVVADQLAVDGRLAGATYPGPAGVRVEGEHGMPP
jgi:hypothetical protein